MIKKIKDAIKSLILQAIINVVDDGGNFKLAKVSVFDFSRSDVPILQQYGFSSFPPPNSQAIIVCPNGKQEDAIIIATDSKEYRDDGQVSGDVTIYTMRGEKIELTRGKINIEAPIIEVNADTSITMSAPVMEFKSTSVDFNIL